MQADANLDGRTYDGDRLLCFQKSPHRKQTKVVEADARATQPGFRLMPSFAKEVAYIDTTTSTFSNPISPNLIFKERRA